ncbi:alpha/beta fold hydrolase [Sphingomonas sp. 35-24ZXX]|uniref:alpha/beta fold hydrolase n=1 Tax=Sphingomonas sp. 35-24ZXX TaxID=1545915 RepID=UPI00053C0202|nr:alpha/beta fold hydrolase [Sphingomonas sp. 35-24ZXX]
MTSRETVILVPGLLCDDDVWTHQSAALGAHYDVIVPDLTRHDSLGGMAAHILDTAPARFSIVGHSMGGRVALEVFRLAPERVARLALLDTGVHPAGAEELPKRQAMLDISAGQGMTALADAWLPPMVRPGLLDTDPALRATLYAMIERMTPAIHRQQITALVNRLDAAPLLAQIHCPTLVGVGEFDLWSPPDQHVPIADAIAGARLVVFKGAGHMAPMETPEAVSAALREWMAS